MKLTEPGGPSRPKRSSGPGDWRKESAWTNPSLMEIDSKLGKLGSAVPGMKCLNEFGDSCGNFTAVSNPLFATNVSELNAGIKPVNENTAPTESKLLASNLLKSKEIKQPEIQLNAKQPGSWATLFREAQLFEGVPEQKELNKKIKKIQNDSCTEVTIEEKLISSARNEWTNSMYGKFYGRTPALEKVQQAMPRI
ncbi:hypothetical protein Cni_G20043 [Canna indica]|uniref:Uncharacterized protein n=1 Tax=Canna indica TaxID=4628 RepID=A0AAQ3QJ35_9LILI|nr:hypothetical protein Cni_G20043 [Canna indica]